MNTRTGKDGCPLLGRRNPRPALPIGRFGLRCSERSPPALEMGSTMLIIDHVLGASVGRSHASDTLSAIRDLAVGRVVGVTSWVITVGCG